MYQKLCVLLSLCPSESKSHSFIFSFTEDIYQPADFIPKRVTSHDNSQATKLSLETIDMYVCILYRSLMHKRVNYRYGRILPKPSYLVIGVQREGGHFVKDFTKKGFSVAWTWEHNLDILEWQNSETCIKDRYLCRVFNHTRSPIYVTFILHICTTFPGNIQRYQNTGYLSLPL